MDSRLKRYKSEVDRMIATRTSKKLTMQYIVENYKDQWYRLALSLSREVHDAEDILSDSFIKIYKSLKKYKVNTNFAAWASRIVVNTFIDGYRKRKKLKYRPVEDLEGKNKTPKDERTPVSRLLAKELREKINEAVRMLPPVQRTVLVMHDIQQAKYEDIAKTLSCSNSTLRVHLLLARKKVRDILKPYLENENGKL